MFAPVHLPYTMTAVIMLRWFDLWTICFRCKAGRRERVTMWIDLETCCPACGWIQPLGWVLQTQPDEPSGVN